jgi:hypothetical protein
MWQLADASTGAGAEMGGERGGGGAVTVELLYFDGCPNHEALVPQLRQLLRSARVDAHLELRRVPDDDAAKRQRFLGSPTVRVGGQDVEPGADQRQDFGLKCRLYRVPAGLRGTPLDEWILEALDGWQIGRRAPAGTARSRSRSFQRS